MLCLLIMSQSALAEKPEPPPSQVQQVAFGYSLYGSSDDSYIEFLAMGFTKRLCRKEDCEQVVVTVLPVQ